MAVANDMDLLREFTSQNSEPAFAELVRRHINLVYSVALRFTGNTGDAQDVTQAVFIILARKAAGLSARTVLTGWLYETTRFTAIRLLRTQARRQAHEQEAFMQSILETPADDNLWRQLAPHLEAAMSRLATADRTLLALRFYENKTGAEAAALLGIREEAARKRTNRALEKLRKFFAKRGVSSTTAIIAGTISAHSVQAAPVALAKTVTAVAIVKGSIAAASTLTLVKGTIKIMTYAKLKLAIGFATAILLAGGAVTVALSDGGNKPAPLASGGQNSSAIDLFIASEFVEVPDNLLGTLGIQWQPMDSGGATAMLTKSQRTNILGTFKQNGVTVLGQPSIAFTPPQPGKSVQGTISMTKPVKIAGTNAETGTILNVEASLSSDSKSVNLNLNVEWRELVDASPLHDGSQNSIRTTKAATVATLTLNPSQTIVIRQPINSDGLALAGTADGSKSLLVFATPQLSHFVQRLQQIIKRNPAQSTGAGANIH